MKQSIRFYVKFKIRVFNRLASKNIKFIKFKVNVFDKNQNKIHSSFHLVSELRFTKTNKMSFNIFNTPPRSVVGYVFHNLLCNLLFKNKYYFSLKLIKKYENHFVITTS